MQTDNHLPFQFDIGDNMQRLSIEPRATGPILGPLMGNTLAARWARSTGARQATTCPAPSLAWARPPTDTADLDNSSPFQFSPAPPSSVAGWPASSRRGWTLFLRFGKCRRMPDCMPDLKFATLFSGVFLPCTLYFCSKKHLKLRKSFFQFWTCFFP